MRPVESNSPMKDDEIYFDPADLEDEIEIDSDFDDSLF